MKINVRNSESAKKHCLHRLSEISPISIKEQASDWCFRINRAATLFTGQNRIQWYEASHTLTAIKNVLYFCFFKVLKLNVLYLGAAIIINMFYYSDPLVGPCKEWLPKGKNLERIFYLLYNNSKIILIPTDLFQHFADFSEITFYYIALH